jgi:hypothetical protein
MDKLLRRDYAAYQSVLESYTLVTDIVEYRHTSDRCAGPRHEPTDEALKHLWHVPAPRPIDKRVAL